MKQAGVILLLAGLWAQTFLQLSVSVSYFANKSFITQKYCVNKDRPELKCFGKCHLKSMYNQVDNAANETQNKIPNQILWQLVPFYFNPLQVLTLPLSHPVSWLLPAKPFLSLYCFSPVFTFFHPPPFVA